MLIAVPPAVVPDDGEIAVTVGAGLGVDRSSNATAGQGPEVFIVTAFVTEDGDTAELSLMAPPTVIGETVKLPLSRKFPVSALNVVLFCSPNAATTQLLPSCVCRATLRFVPDPFVVAFMPKLVTPEYSPTSIQCFAVCERCMVMEVEAATPWLTHISVRTDALRTAAATNV